MKIFTLFELNSSIRRAFDRHFNGMYWVKGEISGLVRSASVQSCYFDLIEKEDNSTRIKAKASAVIWSSIAPQLIHKFEHTTQQRLQSGLSVLLLVKLRYHEQYGFSLDVLDIDPSHTLGGMALKRMETIQRLRFEGLLQCQKALSLPLLVRHIAVVTSATAAGYEDFCRHIADNRYHYPFALQLFPAVMQGDAAEGSIVEALQRITTSDIPFDCVVIIRGGGAVSDLVAFDSYALSAFAARYPLPIITGIGHERDQSVLDMVAHLAQKTPTAVADFLVHRRKTEGERIEALCEQFCRAVGVMLDGNARYLDRLILKLPQSIQQVAHREEIYVQQTEQRLLRNTERQLATHRNALALLTRELSGSIHQYTEQQHSLLERITEKMTYFIPRRQAEEQQKLTHLGTILSLLSPQNTLKRGYSIVRSKGKSITNAQNIQIGDRVDVVLFEGALEAVVTKATPSEKTEGVQ